ncbi:hypothetical protein ACQCX2_07670 [Propionibacteriaceae bacterium Y1700]|uniref:hypothetical protein n=1 Tax=Microlunatus sp. Y1700 TaxID=3418487 RepID=UPI003DA6EC9D
MPEPVERTLQTKRTDYRMDHRITARSAVDSVLKLADMSPIELSSVIYGVAYGVGQSKEAAEAYCEEVAQYLAPYLIKGGDDG